MGAQRLCTASGTIGVVGVYAKSRPRDNAATVSNYVPARALRPATAEETARVTQKTLILAKSIAAWAWSARPGYAWRRRRPRPRPRRPRPPLRVRPHNPQHHAAL